MRKSLCLFYALHQLSFLTCETSVINIILSPRSHLLKEVSVTASKPQYEIKDNGNMVVNIDKIPSSQTDNLFDLFKKLPGVIISDKEGVSLNGLGVQLQLDGRDMSYMDVNSFLKSLPAQALNQIELIYVKGAEHDGKAQSVINLKTRKQGIEGYFGMAGSSFRYLFEDGNLGVGNAFFTLKNKKIMFSNSLGIEVYKVSAMGQDSTYFGNPQKSIVNLGHQTDKEKRINYNSTFIWDIKKGHSLSANLYVFGAKLDRTSQLNYTNYINNTTSREVSNRGFPRLIISGNVEYQLQSFLKLNYGYIYGKSNFDETFTNTYSNSPDKNYVHDENNTESQHILKLDFNKKLLKNKLDLKAGLKETYAKQRNNSQYTPIGTGPNDDISFKDDENIIAFYLSLSYKISNKINATAGMRTERSDYQIKNLLTDINANPGFWNLMPSVQLTIKLSPKYRVMPYLSSNISRPRYMQLFPGKKFIDDYNYSIGNPFLKPTQSYIWAVSNTFISNINLTLGLINTRNIIGDVKIDEENGVTKSTFMNAYDSRGFWLSSSIPFRLFKNKLNANINYNWKTGKYTNFRDEYRKPNGRSKMNDMNLTSNIYYQLTDRIGISSMVTYKIKNTTPMIDYKSYATLDFSLNATLLKNKRLSVAVNFNDVFDSKKNSYEYFYDNNILISKREIPSRNIGINISYRFNGGKSFNQRQREGNDIQRFTN